ncbi:MAG: hypothetical protein J2P57_03085 [Acidimicrobiaceae bacterium]|nr:hypothetical protein [Acidimicrobiaceae bacterium]
MRRSGWVLVGLLGLVAACSSSLPPGRSDPTVDVVARPDYATLCAPSGLDSETPCLQVTLAAIDRARAQEGLKPMQLPATFPRLTVAEQLFVVVDRERVDRHLPPFAGLSAALDRDATQAADTALPPAHPGRGYGPVDTELAGGLLNGLDADYQWMYHDGPGGTARCNRRGEPGCWADRHILLDALHGSGKLVMGAAANSRADTSPGDGGGSTVAAIFARTTHPGPLEYTWADAVAATRAGTLRPRSDWPAHLSATGIPDPASNVPAKPDYIRVCAPSGLDDSATCTAATLKAINTARATEGVRPMVLPSNYRSLTVPEQMLVVIDRERVDRGLPPLRGLTEALDANAREGANLAGDPPDPGAAYRVSDSEWAGGSVSALDADFGWMYADGPGGGNLDCPTPQASGCWGHREGILDNFGTAGNLVMGAAVNPTGDRTTGDVGGTSIAVTLAVTTTPPGAYVYTWAQATAATP